MRKTQLISALIVLATLPCWAYPQAVTGSDGALDSGTSQASFSQYQEKERASFQGYQESRPKTALTDRPSESKTFQDFQQRKAKKEAFELYHRVEDHYEKEPRFSY